LVLNGTVFAFGVEDRLAALEARMEQLAATREVELTTRIRQLEEQVMQLQTVVSSAKASGQEGSSPDRLPDRVVALETRLAGVEGRITEVADEQAMNPLKDISLGGYGELHYNGLSGYGGASNKRELDFHRFVLTVGKKFDDRTRFFSELELEHVMAGEGQRGYMALEQAYIDFDLDDQHTLRGGLFLLPVGLLNTAHEPSRFYGVERNPVENAIIPTTWWEGGAGIYGQLTDTLRYEAYLHSGLKTTKAKNYAIREGRERVAHAAASDPAATVALNWSRPGVTVGGSVQYQSDVTQGGDADPVPALFGEGHVELQRGRWGLRMLYAQWNLDGDGPMSVGADRQYGWYIEPSYKLTDTLGLFTRYSCWDNRAGSALVNSGKEQANFGVNWQPREQVSVKADYQMQFNEDGKGLDGVNLGLGYEF
jgi:phosphate-selective porin